MAKVIYCGDEGADEAEVDESNEEGRSSGGAQSDECSNGPCACQNRYNKEDEDEARRELIVVVESINEPCLGN